jgi:hypothetical protein
MRKGNYTVQPLTSRSFTNQDMRANRAVFLQPSKAGARLGTLTVDSTCSVGFQ